MNAAQRFPDTLIPAGTPASALPDIIRPTVAEWFKWQIETLVGRPADGAITVQDRRQIIAEVEAKMRAAAESGEMRDVVDTYQLVHRFADHQYAREMTIPPGQVVIGKIHRHSHLNFMSKGKATVFTEEGGFETLEAPCTIISPKGVKRLLVTHSETVWTTVHVTDKTDLAEIEEEIIALDYSFLGE